jgi:hypothetical protein
MKRTLILTVLAATVAACAEDKPAAPAAPAAGETKPALVPLKLQLPKAMYVGTPQPIKLPNLEKPRSDPRPDFMVPPGTELLSKGKAVTGSDEYPVIGELSFLTDGNKEATDDTYVELGPGVQHVQVDLGKPAAIYALVLWHYHSQARAYKDVIVQVSNDPDFVKDVKTLYNCDDDNSAGMGIGKDMAYIENREGRLIDAGGAVGRYVRLYSNGNTSNEMNHYIEVEVYGKPAP